MAARGAPGVTGWRAARRSCSPHRIPLELPTHREPVATELLAVFWTE